MGFFDSIKKSLGLSAGEFELKLQPETLHVGGELQGELVLTASKDINIYSVDLEIWHGYPNIHGGVEQDIQQGVNLAERISLRAGERHTWSLFVPIPAQVAPSIKKFSWKVIARAKIEGGSEVKKEQPIQVRHSRVMGAVLDCVQNQFGFKLDEVGADEDGLWMTFEPVGGVKQMFRSLELAFDEQDDEICLWVSLDRFSQAVLQRYRNAYDPSENSIELELDKDRYLSGDQVDVQGIFHLLQPLFVA